MGGARSNVRSALVGIHFVCSLFRVSTGLIDQNSPGSLWMRLHLTPLIGFGCL